MIFKNNFNIIGSYVQQIKFFFKQYKLEKAGYRYSLIDVSFQNNDFCDIMLHVLVQGIKKEILDFSPEEVVYDDELLSEFSPCDIRAITYLSFQKHIVQEKIDLIIVRQQLINGATIFVLGDRQKNEVAQISARKLYENYDFLTKLGKKDMINVISTAVQEQTIMDFESMNIV